MPLHQAVAHSLFQLCHELFDGGRRDAEFAGCVGIVQMTGDRFKGAKRVEGGEPIQHKISLYDEYRHNK